MSREGTDAAKAMHQVVMEKNPGLTTEQAMAETERLMDRVVDETIAALQESNPPLGEALADNRRLRRALADVARLSKQQILESNTLTAAMQRAVVIANRAEAALAGSPQGDGDDEEDQEDEEDEEPCAAGG